MLTLYIFRVNAAIAQLGIETTMVDPTFRQIMISAGYQAGNSPQEVATWIVSQLPLAIRCEVRFQVIRGWIRKRKINPDDPEMVRALREVNYPY